MTAVPRFMLARCVPLSSSGAGPRYCTLTLAVPLRRTSSTSADLFDRSMIRSATNGPRSLTRTTIERPFSRLVTLA
jgi:hypothetical protein